MATATLEGTAARVHAGWLLTALMGGMFLSNVDTAVANTATPAIQAGLGASGGMLQLIVSGYLLTFAVLVVTCARLGQVHGYRRMYLWGLGIFTATSLLCGLAPQAWMLMLARLAQGAGAALMTSQVLTGIQLHFTGAARGRALGWYAAVLAGSAVLGQLAGGALVGANLFDTGWRPIFLVNVPLGVMLLVIAARALPADESHSKQRMDVAGVLALSVSLLLLVFPLVLGRDEGWPLWTFVSLAASVPAMAVFVRLQRTRAHPVLDLDLFRHRTVRWALIANMSSTSTYFGLLFVIALYLQEGLGQSPAVSGMALISWVAAFGVAGPFLARMSDRAKVFSSPAGAVLLTAAFGAVAAAVAAGDTDVALLIVLLGFGGLGFGAMFSGTLAQLTGAVTEKHAADISGLLNTASRVGGVFGVAAFGTAYLAMAPSPDRAIDAFAITAAVMAAVSAAAGLASWHAARHMPAV